jgi:hypothetical protein
MERKENKFSSSPVADSQKLEKKIRLDLNSGMVGKRELEVSVLRQLLAAVLNKEKEKRFKSKEAKEVHLTDEEITGVISSEVKKRKEAIEFFVKGDRPNLAEKENKELEILGKYLPEQMSEQDLKILAEAAVEKTGAKTVKDMGRVMAELMPKTKGRADGTLISKIVKELLANDR